LRMSLPVLAFTREECKSLYDAYMACNHDKSFVARAFGVCEESKFLLDKCLRAEVRLTCKPAPRPWSLSQLVALFTVFCVSASRGRKRTWRRETGLRARLPIGCAIKRPVKAQDKAGRRGRYLRSNEEATGVRVNLERAAVRATLPRAPRKPLREQNWRRCW
jgi:hypothetical protein